MYQITYMIGVGENHLGEPLDDVEPRIAHGMREVCKVFGGVTSTRGKGMWQNPDGITIAESALILTTLLDKDHPQVDPSINIHAVADDVADTLRRIFQQTAVRVTVAKVKTWDRYEKTSVPRKEPQPQH